MKKSAFFVVSLFFALLVSYVVLAQEGGDQSCKQDSDCRTSHTCSYCGKCFSKHPDMGNGDCKAVCLNADNFKCLCINGNCERDLGKPEQVIPKQKEIKSRKTSNENKWKDSGYLNKGTVYISVLPKEQNSMPWDGAPDVRVRKPLRFGWFEINPNEPLRMVSGKTLRFVIEIRDDLRWIRLNEPELTVEKGKLVILIRTSRFTGIRTMDLQLGVTAKAVNAKDLAPGDYEVFLGSKRLAAISILEPPKSPTVDKTGILMDKPAKVMNLKGDVITTMTKGQPSGCSGCGGWIGIAYEIQGMDLYLGVSGGCSGKCEAFWPFRNRAVITDLKSGKYRIFFDKEKFDFEIAPK
jgi:hypothetical protein